MKYVRPILVWSYVLLALLAFWQPVTPRVLWTMVMPVVPLAITVFGFAWWRGVCPIASIGWLGARCSAARGSRAPALLRRFPLSVALVILGVALVARLVAINGDGPALGVALVLLALAAFVVNAFWGGRSFCNYVCPVGVVERIYTDGAPLLEARPEPCRPCTGCKARCPDADQERAFEHDLMSRDRRAATYAFPGLVLGFYAYYLLREGQWEAFFDGRWTTIAIGRQSLFGPGFVFWPEVPALVAASFTLLVTSALGSLLFHLVERALAAHESDAELVRRRTLALAAFTAFNTFYLFAGAPTLLLLPAAPRVIAFVVPVVATIVLLRRWQREPLSPARIALPVISERG